MKIGILLPSQYDVATLCRTRELCRLLLELSSLAEDAITIAVGLPERPEPEWRKNEAYLRSGRPQVICRHLRWESVLAANALRMFAKHGLPLDLSGIDRVLVPRDWGWNFTDCDLWVNFADPGMGAVLPLKPTAHYVADLAMRIVPNSFAVDINDPLWTRQVEAFRLWRQSALVLVSDPWSADDVVGYGGVRRNKVMLVPSLSFNDEPVEQRATRLSTGTWVWLLEANARHDLKNAVMGLEIYLREGGKNLPVIACQDSAACEYSSYEITDSLDSSISGSDDKRAKASSIFESWTTSMLQLWARLPVVQYSEYRELSRLLNSAQMLWSSEIAGGDGYSLALAAKHGLPFLGFNFPSQARIAEQLGTSALLYEESDPIFIADALHKMDANSEIHNHPRDPMKPAAIRLQRYGFMIDRLMEHQRD